MWGIVAIVLLLATALLTLFNGEPYSISGNLVFLALPVALQEMFLAVWLIVKGFNLQASSLRQTGVIGGLQMKAIVYTKYGPPEVLRLQEVEKPAPQGQGSAGQSPCHHRHPVTIGDTSCAVSPSHRWQWLMARLIWDCANPNGRILGMELAGEIESIGRKVTRFKPGDPVFASTFAVNFGGHAEYKCLPENGVLALKPANLTYEEAAAVPGAGQTAWQCLKKGKIQPGQKVLIYGASGAVGTYAVQLASRHFGAEVTGVCSGANLELVNRWGRVRLSITPGRTSPKAAQPTTWFLTPSETAPCAGQKGAQARRHLHQRPCRLRRRR